MIVYPSKNIHLLVILLFLICDMIYTYIYINRQRKYIYHCYLIYLKFVQTLKTTYLCKLYQET